MSEVPKALDVVRAVQWLGIPGIEKAVLIAIILNPRMSHVSWVGNPSAPALAMASGFKDRRVRTALKTLSNHRYITRVGNHGGGNVPSDWRVEAFRIMSAAAVVRDDSVCGVHGMQGCTVCRGACGAHAPIGSGDLDTLEDKEPPSEIGACASGAGVHVVQPIAKRDKPPKPEPPPEPTNGSYADAWRLSEVWQEELDRSPKELRGKPAGVSAMWPIDLIAAGPEDAEVAVRAIAELCRGTQERMPRVLEWRDFFSGRGADAAWRKALAWKRGVGGEPRLDRAWRKDDGGKGDAQPNNLPPTLTGGSW